MYFILSKLFWIIAAPGMVLLLALLCGLVLVYRKPTSVWGCRLILLVVVSMMLVTFTPVAALIALPLENRFARPVEMPGKVDGIISLGGAVNPYLAERRNEASVNDSAERLLAFAELVRRYPDARAVVSGGSGRLFGQSFKEDVPALGALRQAGLDTDRLIFEGESRNTVENALFSKAIVDPKPGENWLLVTSAIHMPRAVGLFRAVGWQVIPYPVDYRTAPDASPWVRFEAERAMVLLNEGIREWLGLLSQWLAGRSSSLFPAP